MKRSSERQITKDDRSDDEADGAGADGTFQRAPPEVLARRRIIKVRRRAAAGGGAGDEENDGGDEATAVPPAPPAVAFPTSLGAAVTSGDVASAADNAEPASKAVGDARNTSVSPAPAAVSANAAAAANDGPAAAANAVTNTSAAAAANDVPSTAAVNDASAATAANTTTEAAVPSVAVVAPVASGSDAAVPTSTSADAHADGAVDSAKAEAPKGSDANNAAGSTGNADKPDAAATVGEANKTIGADVKAGGASSEPAATVATAPKPAFTFGGFSGDVAGGFTFGTTAAGGQPFSFGSGGTSFAVPPALAGGAPFGALPAGGSSGSGAPPATTPSGAPPRPDMKQVEAHTGEEEESVLYHARAKLYLLEGGANWKERGVGVVKLNVHSSTGAGRLLMRTEATLHVILNTPLFSGFAVDRAADRAVRFTGLSLEDVKKNVSYLLRFSVKDDAAGLVDAISNHIKGVKDTTAKEGVDETAKAENVSAKTGQTNEADATAGEEAKTADAKTGVATSVDGRTGETKSGETKAEDALAVEATKEGAAKVDDAKVSAADK
ncbi:hypothetical protein MMPV_009206 [Pyropia vietnamensis]